MDAYEKCKCTNNIESVGGIRKKS